MIVVVPYPVLCVCVISVATLVWAQNEVPATGAVANQAGSKATGATVGHVSMASVIAEADRMRGDKPDKWRQWDDQAADFLSKRDARLQNWQKHSLPPPADLSPLGLPLPYLVWQCRTPDSVKREAGERLTWEAAEKQRAYLRAISSSPDGRRIDVLLELLGKSDSDGELLAKAMTSDRAEASVRDLLAGSPKLDRKAPLPTLLRDFAGQLSPDTRKAGYDWIQTTWGKGPTNGDGEVYWETLFRLDLTRARSEVIPYYGKAEIGFYVARVLLEHAGPSEEVAEAVRAWRREKPVDVVDRLLRKVLVCSDPARELQAYVAGIEAELRSVKRSDEAPYLVRALVEHIPRESVEYLRLFANDRRLTGLMGEGVRLDIVAWLVRQRDEKAEQIVARWFAEENRLAQHYLTDRLARQDEFSRELLKKLRPDIKLPPLPNEKAPVKSAPPTTQRTS